MFYLSFQILGGRNLTRALQSSPFQNPGGVPWAWRRSVQIVPPRKNCINWIYYFLCPAFALCPFLNLSKWFPRLREWYFEFSSNFQACNFWATFTPPDWGWLRWVCSLHCTQQLYSVYCTQKVECTVCTAPSSYIVQCVLHPAAI